VFYFVQIIDRISNNRIDEYGNWRKQFLTGFGLLDITETEFLFQQRENLVGKPMSVTLKTVCQELQHHSHKNSVAPVNFIFTEVLYIYR